MAMATAARRIAEILISHLEGAEPGAELTLKMAKDGRLAAPRMLRSEVG